MPDRPPDGDDRPGERGRVPPHDYGAERALLGALLLSADAVEACAGLWSPGDFYRPAHQHVATAIARVAARSEAVDPVTVRAQLDADGHRPQPTDDGEPHWASLASLSLLQADAPGTVNAAHYAGIVTGHARSRRLIDAAAAFYEQAWQAPDPDQLLVDHRGRLDELGSSLATTSHVEWADIGVVIDGGAKVPEPDVLDRGDGKRLFYLGKLHTLQAAPSTGKSWLALLVVADVIAMGGSAAYLDWEDEPNAIVGRLLALGCSPDDLRARFRYARLVGSWDAAEHTDVHRQLAELGPDVVVIDGVAQAIAFDGGDENDASDCLRWIGSVPEPIARATGAAVVMLDHVTKATEKGDRYARGSGSKLARIDGATYVVTVAEPYSRTKSGRMRLTCAKDRGGNFAIGETVADVVVTPSAGGEVVRMAPEPPADPTDRDFQPTRIMVRVSAILERGPVSAEAVKAELERSKPGIVERAIRELIRLGHVENTKGLTGGHALKVVRPYHGPDAPAPGDDHQVALDLEEPPSDFDPDPGF